MTHRLILTSGFIVLLGLLPAHAADKAVSFSATDKAFVAKVSQGGMYEMLAGYLAESKAVAQDVKNLGSAEAHDHRLVGNKLKAIMRRHRVKFPKDLNADFQARLDVLKAASAPQFDAAYLADMKKVHDADGAAFAREARSGNDPELKAFAAETYRIVRRHLGGINASIR